MYVSAFFTLDWTLEYLPVQAAEADTEKARAAAQAGAECQGEGRPQNSGARHLEDQLPGPSHHRGLVQAARGAHREDLQQEPAVQVPLEHGSGAGLQVLSRPLLRAAAGISPDGVSQVLAAARGGCPGPGSSNSSPVHLSICCQCWQCSGCQGQTL